jgi:Putative collagen-binding domain of a collagenase
VPDLSILTGDVGENVAARSSGRTWAVEYLPSKGTVNVSMTAGKSAEPSWMNPATGAMQTLGVFPRPVRNPSRRRRTGRMWSFSSGPKTSAFALR